MPKGALQVHGITKRRFDCPCGKPGHEPTRVMETSVIGIAYQERVAVGRRLFFRRNARAGVLCGGYLAKAAQSHFATLPLKLKLISSGFR